MEASFERRKGRGRSISVSCLACGYTQYDICPGSRRAEAEELDCPQCRQAGPVREVLKVAAHLTGGDHGS